MDKRTTMFILCNLTLFVALLLVYLIGKYTVFIFVMDQNT